MKKHYFAHQKSDLRAGHIQLLITEIQSSLFFKLLQNRQKSLNKKIKTVPGMPSRFLEKITFLNPNATIVYR